MFIDVLEVSQHYHSEANYSKLVTGKTRQDSAFIVYLAKVIEQHAMVKCNWSKSVAYERTTEMEEWLESYLKIPENESYKYDAAWNLELSIGKMVAKEFASKNAYWKTFSVEMEHGFLKLVFGEDYRVVMFNLGETRPDDMPVDGYNSSRYTHRVRVKPVEEMAVTWETPKPKKLTLVKMQRDYLHQSIVRRRAATCAEPVMFVAANDNEIYDVTNRKAIYDILVDHDGIIAIKVGSKVTRYRCMAGEIWQVTGEGAITIASKSDTPEYHLGLMGVPGMTMKQMKARAMEHCISADGYVECLTTLEE